MDISKRYKISNVNVLEPKKGDAAADLLLPCGIGRIDRRQMVIGGGVSAGIFALTGSLFSAAAFGSEAAGQQRTGKIQMKDSDMNSYYKELLDEYACRRLQEKYWRALSERDADAIANLFTPEGRWGRARGSEEIKQSARKVFLGLEALEFMSTHVGSIKLLVEGDSATGAIEGIAHHVVKGTDGPRIVVANALYYLTYVRQSDGWRIASMTGKQHPDELHDSSYQFNVPMAKIDYGIPGS